MAAKAREEQEILLRRIDPLEIRLAALERRGIAGPGPSVHETPLSCSGKSALASPALLWQRNRFWRLL